VLGLHLTVRRIVGLAVLACLLYILAVSISDMGGDEGDIPPVDNETGRYEEGDTDWVLCSAFIFLAIVLLAILAIEIGS
jgi:hypothetical protein